MKSEDAPPDRQKRRGFGAKLFGRGGAANGERVVSSQTVAEAAAETSRNDMRLRLHEFETMRVGDVMVPRAEVAAVEMSTSLRELIREFAENTVSRMPVYVETLDNPVGFIHLKDIIAEIAQGNTDPDTLPIERLKRELLYVPPSMRLADLLVKMQTSRNHIALVIDEYGGTDGLVTLEDLVEQIVGEIEDEHDEEEGPLFQLRGRGIWDADARANIEIFEAASGLDLSIPQLADEIETLGGLAFALAGRVPQRGELIKHPAGGVDFEIVEADARRIRRMRVRTSAAKPRVTTPDAVTSDTVTPDKIAPEIRATEKAKGSE